METSDQRGDWMITFSGRKYYPFAPRACDVDIVDIAHHLSMMVRWFGACRTFYSVAEHSVHVSNLVPHLAALLHDAHEAYTGDVIRPVKRHLNGYDVVCQKNQDAIHQHFDITVDDDLAAQIKQADDVVLATERRDITAQVHWHDWEDIPDPVSEVIVPVEWHRAKQLFLDRFGELKRSM
jgi:hypothetical protein